MTQTWPAGDDNGDGGDSRTAGVARRAIPVVVTDGGAADAWRRAARVVAWVGALAGGVMSVSFAVQAASATSPGGALRELTAAFRGASLAEVLLSVSALARVVLMGLLLAGSVGVLVRRRWGAVVLMTYAVVAVPAAAAYVGWIAAREYPSGSMRMVLTGTIALNSLQSLAFPAVVFFVIRAARPHLGKAALGSAFEPLAPMPGGPTPSSSPSPPPFTRQT